MLFNFTSLKEFENHSSVSFLYDKETGLKSVVAIHRGDSKFPSFGATRVFPYLSEGEALKDALRLSELMSYKCALAGLKYGGAKGVIIVSNKVKSKNILLKSYAKKLNLLNGNFITGADVGLDDSDVRMMSKISPYFVGIKSHPVRFTALGLLYSLEVCLKEVFGTKSLDNRTFAIQGLGRVGEAFLQLIYKNSGRIVATDLDKSRIKLINKKYPKVEIVAPQDIYKEQVDVFSPCALAGSINSRSINQLGCKIILGGANNQLESEEIGKLLYRLGILYAPDYVVNAGGLISVVDEYEHKSFSPHRTINRLLTIKQKLNKIIELSRIKKKPMNIIADEMAREIFNNH